MGMFGDDFNLESQKVVASPGRFCFPWIPFFSILVFPLDSGVVQCHQKQNPAMILDSSDKKKVGHCRSSLQVLFPSTMSPQKCLPPSGGFLKYLFFSLLFGLKLGSHHDYYIFRFGDPYEPSFATVTGRGGQPK